MDLIMSQQSGVLNTVASSGTALTELHLKKIQKLSNRVVVAYDSDSAGEKASIRAGELALSLSMEVKIASLPKGEDPASVAKKNPEKWRGALKKAEHFTDFILNKAVKENTGRNLTKEILKSVLPVASLIKSDIEKTQFIKKIALKMRVSEEAVWNDLSKIERLKDGKTERLEKEENFGKDEKEALLFEAERYGFKIDTKKIDEDILKKKELKNLKQKLQETVILLDDPSLSKAEEKKAKSDLEKIQKRIEKLNN